jgi:hypothetical protein
LATTDFAERERGKIFKGDSALATTDFAERERGKIFKGDFGPCRHNSSAFFGGVRRLDCRGFGRNQSIEEGDPARGD